MTIDRHLQQCAHCKECFTKKPNVQSILNHLQGRISQLHNQIKMLSDEASLAIVKRHLPGRSSGIQHSCSRCGYTSSKLARVMGHLSSRKSSCKQAKLLSSDVLSNEEYGITISRAWVKGIRDSSILLPWCKDPILHIVTPEKGQKRPADKRDSRSTKKKGRVGTIHNLNSTTHVQSLITNSGTQGTSSEVGLRSTDENTTTIQEFSRYSADPTEMAFVTSDSYAPIAANKHISAVNSMKDCFGDDNFDHKWRYVTLFHHFLSDGSQPLKSAMNAMVDLLQPLRFDSSKDVSELKHLLSAGRSWLESEAANMDVRSLDAFQRSLLYSIGASEEPNEEDLMRGKTFVPTRDVTRLGAILDKLLIFLCRKKWPRIQSTLEQVRDIEQAVEIIQGDNVDIEDAEYDMSVANRIVDTNIIPGIIVNVINDAAGSPNGPIVANEFVALLSVKRAPSGDLLLRQPNELSKSLNDLLRLSRHGLVSHFERVRLRVSGDDEDFRAYVMQCANEISKTRFTHWVCGAIRLAKEINNKTHNSVYKAHDPATGEVKVGQVSIDKAIWSKAIPTTLEYLHESIAPFYTRAADLHEFLDPRNKIILERDDAVVTVSDDFVQSTKTISLQSMTPSLYGVNDAQNLINQLWTMIRGSLLYISSGAMRGEEGGRLPSHEHWQVVFNMLRFQSYSRKNESHGMENNTMVTRYLPPSISRYVILAYRSLYPAVSSHATLTLPKDSSARDCADNAFQIIMGLEQPLGTKVNRDIIGVICNYICPDSEGRTTTRAEYAQQFSHSQAIHTRFYSSEVFERKPDGTIMRSDVMVARDFHRSLGEAEASFSDHLSGVDLSCSDIDRDMLNRAAQYAYRKNGARPSKTQSEIIMVVEDSNDKHNVVALMPCGSGKSALYLLPLVAMAQNGTRKKRTIVISPHNPLLQQHYKQATTMFQGLSLVVTWIRSENDIAADDFPHQFDLCFISIHAFKQLVDRHRNIIASWQVEKIFVDECHLMYLEFFRHHTSWEALHNLSVFRAKIICMSATLTLSLSKHIAHFTGMGNYKFLGNPTETIYSVPNVSINIINTTKERIMSEVVEHVIERLKFYKSQSRLKTMIHVITRTKDHAKLGSEEIKRVNPNINSDWLTSDATSEERTTVMNNYSDGDIDVLWSTYDVGYDNSIVRDVVIMNGSSSLISFIQAIGRIRPSQQCSSHTNGRQAQVNVFLTPDWPQTMDNSEIKAMLDQWARISLTCNSSVETTQMYMKLFTHFKLKRILQSNECTLKTVFDAFDVHSTDCGRCSNCLIGNNIVIRAEESQQALIEEENHMDESRDALLIMESRCYYCRSSLCTGVRCLPIGYCFKCFTTSCSERDKCPFRNPNMHGRACAFCFLPQDLRSDNANVHGKGKCIHKERIKRVLLFGCEDGNDAKSSLHGCFQVTRDWSSIFSKKLKTIARIKNRN